MSLIKKLFGLRSFVELKQSADALFAAGDFGAAKIEYERAKERSSETDQSTLALVVKQIDICRDEIAKNRIAKAEEFLKSNDLHLAIAELDNAADIAASDDIVQTALQLKEKAERAEVLEQNVDFHEQTDEERWVTIAGSWEEAQTEEYEKYGDALRDALLALDDNRVKEAREKLENILEQAKDPHYLYFELGKIRLLDGDLEKGAEALRTFLSRIGPEEGGDTRLMAHTELARIANEAKDFEGAIAQLQKAIESMPKDPRPYLLMGNFFRQEGHLDEAIEVLEAGLDMMVASDVNPDWRLVQELGLTYSDQEKNEKAIEYLEQVVNMLVTRHHLDLPPETTVRLAQLHEKAGNKARAADLYSMLAHGSDRANYFRYYYESGRLLADIGETEDARRALMRANEVAPNDEKVREEIKALLTSIKDGRPKDESKG
jgi:tetratricopeptide (TPR) repeat protein